MATPRDPTARRFYRAGRQRLEDGESLRQQGRYGGAVYLAGYGIECGLKSMLVEQTPPARRPTLVASFRGSVAHDFDWLRRRYRDSGGSAAPAEVLAAFLTLDTWRVELRYNPTTPKGRDVAAFFAAARRAFGWIDGRIS